MPGKHSIDSPAGRVILANLAQHAPASIDTLVRLTGYHMRTVRDFILRLHRTGQAHVAEFRHEHEHAHSPAKLWAAGAGEDAQRIGRPPRTHQNACWATSDGASRLLARLTCGAGTIKTLCADGAISDSAARPLLRQMVAAGVIHLSAYLRAAGVGGMHTKVYSLGPGRAAKRPAPRPKKALYQEWRARKIARFGAELAGAMLRSRNNNGAQRVVMDGRVVYERRPAA